MIRAFWHRLRDRFQRDALDRELSEELRHHQTLLERDSGIDPAFPHDRAAAARRRLGNTTSIREQARDVWGWGFVDAALTDVRLALRALRRSTGFAAGVIFTLALGVGANATMFGIIDRLMMRPLPYLDDPGSVNRVYLRARVQGQVVTTSDDLEYTRYLDLLHASTTTASMAAVTQLPLAVGTGDDVSEREVAPVSASFWGFFRMRPALGRFFSRADDSVPTGSPVAVLGYDYWKESYGGRTGVIGQPLRVGNVNATIIGVAPRGFSGMSDSLAPAIYIPITAYAGSQPEDGATYYNTYRWGWLSIILRRKPGVSAAQASADLTHAYALSVQAQHALEPGAPSVNHAQPSAIVSALKTGAGPEPGAQARTALWVGGVAIIVLLIACANVANLFLMRAMRRRREVAVRLALGVSRWRLVVQQLSESLVLALFAGVAGMLFAEWGSAGIRRFFGYDSSSLALLTDWRVLRVSAGIALLVGVITGLGPALQSARSDLTQALRSGARAGASGRARLSNTLLVLQAALSALLLVGAGLFVRSMHAVHTMHVGFDADPVVIAVVSPRGARLSDSAAISFSHRALEAGQAIPGVEHAAWVNAVPFLTLSSTNIEVEGIDSVRKLGQFTYQAVTPDYFATMGTRIVRGRPLGAGDVPGAPHVVVVSQGMAHVLWPSSDAIGKCFRIGGLPDCFTVVGIAEDAHQLDLLSAISYQYYVPIAQFRSAAGFLLLLKVHGDPAHQLEPIRRALQGVMPGDYYVSMVTLHDVLDSLREPWEFGATMFTAFGVLALIVAGIGLYALIGYGVTQRMHELGVRIALGAQRGQILRLIVLRGLGFAAAGTAIGVALSLAAAHWLEPLLFHESARDPLVIGVATLTVLLVAAIGTSVPARRAADADPNAALRAE